VVAFRGVGVSVAFNSHDDDVLGAATYSVHDNSFLNVYHVLEPISSHAMLSAAKVQFSSILPSMIRVYRLMHLITVESFPIGIPTWFKHILLPVMAFMRGISLG
jgi:hypothetical protein